MNAVRFGFGVTGLGVMAMILLIEWKILVAIVLAVGMSQGWALFYAWTLTLLTGIPATAGIITWASDF